MNDDLINREQFLLQKKDTLVLEQNDLKNQIEDVERKIFNYGNELEIYKKCRKEIVNRYAINVFQVAGTGALVDIPIHVLSGNFDGLLVGDYIVIGCVLYAVGLLTVDVIVELKNYKKNNNLNLPELESKCIKLYELLEKNNNQVNTATLELDEISESFLSKNKEKVK